VRLRLFAFLREEPRRGLKAAWLNSLAASFAVAKNLGDMFSHVVIFWTDPAQADAVDKLIAGANQFLKDIPGLAHFHVGKMAASHRPVVDQSYQVALNTAFTSKQAQDDYQVHPQHIEFVEKVFKQVCKQVRVYDFE